MKEKWTHIRGYYGLYEISTHGRVRSMPRKPGGNIKMRKLTKMKKGGYCVSLTDREGNQLAFPVAKLILKSFTPTRSKHNRFVSFNNGNRFDHRLSNLSWTPTPMISRWLFSGFKILLSQYLPLPALFSTEGFCCIPFCLIYGIGSTLAEISASLSLWTLGRETLGIRLYLD